MLWPRLWLCCQLSLPLAYVAIGHLELVEKGPVQNRAMSPDVPRHIAREFYPITWPRALYRKHCTHLQCGAFYYTYWAWFPPKVTKSEAVWPQLRFQPQKTQREQESEAKKRGWIGGGRMGVGTEGPNTWQTRRQKSTSSRSKREPEILGGVICSE